jgi:mono/diheme cytochrome c family protein
MKKAGTRMAFLLALIFAAQAFAAQGPPPATSLWTASPNSGQGKPKGYVQYQNYCEACHGKGADKPGTVALETKYQGKKPALLEQRTDLTREAVKAFVRNGIFVMPRSRKTEISDADLDAIADYLARNYKP